MTTGMFIAFPKSKFILTFFRVTFGKNFGLQLFLGGFEGKEARGLLCVGYPDFSLQIFGLWLVKVGIWSKWR